MRKIGPIFVLFLLAIGLLWVSNAKAAIINAASCSQANVQTAINSSSSGDTVVVPSGTCTWSSGVTIHNKSINLIGPGAASLTITATSEAAIILTAASGGGNASRISGFKFILSTSTTGVYVPYDLSKVPQGWRIDHNTFQCNTWQTMNPYGVHVYGAERANEHPSGLVDNCIFNNTRILVWGGNGYYAGNNRWYDALDMGSANAVYAENCTFNHDAWNSNSIDANTGGRYVFRYNTTYGAHIEAHSVQESNQRATRLWEIYRNSLNMPTGVTGWNVTNIRGGTGVAFDNIYGDRINARGFLITNDRSCNSYGSWGDCDGTVFVDGNESGKKGYLCRDQIGASTDASLWNFSNPAPVQQKSPAYGWNNTYGSTHYNFVRQEQCVSEATHLVENRDFYNGKSSAQISPTSPFNGTTGVGWGTTANRPTTCTIGVGYWATDQGSWNQSGSGGQGVLYKCTATNTWTLYYTPYTYPHPLRNEGPPDTTPPTIPTNLTGTAVSSSQINLSWTASTDNVGVTGYRIYRCQGSGCTPSTQIATSATNSYSNTGLSASTTYVYRVAAYDAAGNVSGQSSSASATTQAPPDTTPPSVPTNLSATAVSSTQINLSWTASTDNVGVTGYRIYRCQGSGCTPSTQIATSATNSYSNTGLSASTTYVYRVAAYDAAGNVSGQSSSASATTQAPPDTTPPAPPTGLRIQ